MDTSINNITTQFETPHSGSNDRKIRLALIIVIILGATILNLWYYFNLFKAPIAEAPEVIVLPTEEEKVAIASDLETRVAKISNEDKAKMMQSLAVVADSSVKLEDRESAVKPFQN